MPPSSRQRGSGGPPLLRDYLIANRQQGAQQAEGMASYLGQQQQGARSQVDAAEQAITQQRLQPAFGTIGQVTNDPNNRGTVPGIAGPATPSPEMAGKVLEGPRVEMSQTEPGLAAIAQVNRAATMGQMATTPAGMAAINAQRYGIAGPRTSGGSLLDASITHYGGGARVRAQARQGAGLRGYLSNAVDRGNKAAEEQALQWMAVGAPPPKDPTLTPPRTGSQPGRPPSIIGAPTPSPRDWWRENREYKFGG